MTAKGQTGRSSSTAAAAALGVAGAVTFGLETALPDAGTDPLGRSLCIALDKCWSKAHGLDCCGMTLKNWTVTGTTGDTVTFGAGPEPRSLGEGVRVTV